jgi:hypothetical protein
MPRTKESPVVQKVNGLGVFLDMFFLQTVQEAKLSLTLFSEGLLWLEEAVNSPVSWPIACAAKAWTVFQI